MRIWRSETRAAQPNEMADLLKEYSLYLTLPLCKTSLEKGQQIDNLCAIFYTLLVLLYEDIGTLSPYFTQGKIATCFIYPNQYIHAAEPIYKHVESKTYSFHKMDVSVR